MKTQLSFWEWEHWFKKIDYAVIGGGIVGLSCALYLKGREPAKRVVVFEKGMLPSGASTKNAGFACFGSCSEMLEDLKSHTEDVVVQLVNMRLKGLENLKALLGARNIGLEDLGGYEVFRRQDQHLFESCMDQLGYLNKLMAQTVLGKKKVFSAKKDPFFFKKCQKQLIFNAFEAQLDTGAMMQALIHRAHLKGIVIINGAEVSEIQDAGAQPELLINNAIPIRPQKVFLATNGFARELLDLQVRPARAQVLITTPIEGLHIRGTFHMDRGYYYFRNVGDRLLLGGGRNLDFKAEETTSQETTRLIQQALEDLIRTTILPGIPFKIERRWSGTMGVGLQKRPVVKQLGENLYCGVRLGGMGVAIGSLVGKQLAGLSEG